MEMRLLECVSWPQFMAQAALQGVTRQEAEQVWEQLLSDPTVAKKTVTGKIYIYLKIQR